jgi:hypothetical protein
MCLAAQPETSQACSATDCSLYTAAGWMGSSYGKIFKVAIATGATTELSAPRDYDSVLGTDGTSLVRLGWNTLTFVNPTTLATSSTVTLSSGLGEPGAIVWTGTGFFATSSWGSLYSITPTGTVTSLGNTSLRSKTLLWDAASSSLYTCGVQSPSSIRKISTTNASTLSTVALTSSTGTVSGCFGLTTTTAGTTYILYRLSDNWSMRRLGTVDLTTGVVTDIGPAGSGFRSLVAL